MTNADGNAGETPPSDPGSQPSEPSSSGYEAPSIEHSQDRPDIGGAQPSYEYGPPSYGANPPYPPAIDYPADIPHDYPPPPAFPGASSYPPPYPPPMPGYPPPPGYGVPGGYPGYPGGYGIPPSATTNTPAIGSLVASIVSLFLFAMCGIGLLAAVVGIGLGVTALNQIKKTGQAGHGLAIAGIAVGAVGAILNTGMLLFFLIGAFAA
ncbi:DUF4190 domain-containing protein [Mycolicibacterium neworleansense]|uniref:Peptidyl-prolyl cis-trans isomerase n=1 Tax=Mycolicibacterium neworleansense TaxID=146018 RepID=A0A0H5RW45_9MYCO|nr:DUF4190 domain-containing protein [Mycolicibacterium neworleansense]MCV7360741.1 DUF4190 domain-containing protein [Mycolicibacterium neworleansense]CRZ18148.1 peptidyl-prolyl cis-trans isomerase [Mycolicibacterium neworleansense]